MDLKDFSKVKLNSENNETETKNATQSTKNDGYAEIISSFLAKFGTMSEDDLLAEMLKLIEKQKAEGTYDAEKVKNLVSTIRPFLNSSQQKKIDDLVGYLD